MKIENFWDIEAWKEARKLTNLVYCSSLDGDFKKDYGLVNQIQRASVSVMANIAEGFGRGTDKEFKQFLIIARGSNLELQSHLFIALDLKYVSDVKFNEIFDQSKRAEKVINAFISYLKKSA